MNHLIVGLGGTGGKIIRSFRKAILQNFRKTSPDGVNVEYLYVDSDDRDMGLDDPKWKILGESVQLTDKGQLKIKSADLRGCLANLSNYPPLEPWLGSSDDWKDVLGGIADTTIGGQRRRVGRFLFARGVQEFNRKIQRLVQDLQAKGGTQTTFHVICGLAGGTGSGSVIDAIAQIRKTYPLDVSRSYPLLVYALLPDRVPKDGWNLGNYWSNGYAALAELNGFSVERWRPTDIGSNQERAGRVSIGKPFDGCYLISNENGRITVDVENDIPDIVASFLYQKIIVVRDNTWLSQLGRIESCENGDSSPEHSPSTRQPERSRFFLTFGVKKLTYPEDEIREYITYNFGLQAANQLRFNNWVENLGFADQARNQAFSAQVKAPELMNRWKLSEDHLLLSKGILPEDAKNQSWKSLHDEWHDLIAPYTMSVKGGQNKFWLAEIKRLFDERYKRDFRKTGVASFYSSHLAAKAQHSREICRIIETQLFDDWANGERSMYDTSEFLGALIAELGTRKADTESKISAGVNELDTIDAQIEANLALWPNVGVLGQLMGQRNNLLNAQALVVAKHYEQLTLAEAREFAKQLLVQLAQDLSEIKSSIDTFASRISEVTTKYKTDLKERVREGQTDQGGTQPSQGLEGHQQVVRFYDAKRVVEITRVMTIDQPDQFSSTREVRQALISLLGETKTFGQLAKEATPGKLRDTIDNACRRHADVAHENLVQRAQQRVLGINVVDKLRERYDGNADGLRKFVKDLVGHADNYLVMNPDEADRNVPGLPANRQPLSNTTIILPASDDAAFSGTLANEFRDFAPGGATIVPSLTRKNEIVIISLMNMFPLRYVKMMEFLRDKYNEKMTGSNSKRAKLEGHIEGDGSDLPRVFLPSGSEPVDDAIPYLLLARGMKLVQEIRNPQGNTEWALLTKDADGFDADPVFLGRTIGEASSKINLLNSDLIRSETEKMLARAEYQSDAKREELRAAILADVELVKVERGNNLNDETFKRFRDGGKRAFALLGQAASGA